MKNLWKTYPVAVISLGVCLVFAGVTFAFSWQLATVELLFLLGCLAFELLHLYFHGRRVQRAVLQISNSLSFPDQKSAQDFPLPILAVDSGGKVLWFNDLFRTRVLGGKKLEDAGAIQFTSGVPVEEILAQDSVPVEYDGLRYTVYANRVSDHSDAATVLYYIDDTQRKNISPAARLYCWWRWTAWMRSPTACGIARRPPSLAAWRRLLKPGLPNSIALCANMLTAAI